MLRALVAAAVVLLVLAGWLAVQAAARRFAARHPEFGPARSERAGGCGHCAQGDDGHCARDKHC